MRIHSIDRRALLFGSGALLASCASAPPAAADPTADEDFRALVDRLAERSRQSRAFLLRRYDARRLTPHGRILYEAILPGAEADAALARMRWGQGGFPYAVTHRTGFYRRAAELRVDDTPRYATREIVRDTNRINAEAARGVIPPAFAFEPAIAAIEDAARRIRERQPDQTDLLEALARQVETLREVHARAGNEPGLWRLPDGEAYYATLLKFHLGAAVDAREAHARAIDRCRELHAQADTLLRAQSLSEGDVATRLRALARDPRYQYEAGDAGKDRAVADMDERLDRIRTLLAGVLEDARATPAGVRRLPAQQENNGMQGRRQGSFYLVDLGAPRARWTLPSVVHHELIPGHIYQAPFAGAANAPVLQQRYSNGYAEGWSIYAEQLADESGAFADDPLSRIGYLQWMLFRMGRIVVDTGIHVMRWNRERAIAEMTALQGESIAFVSIEEDVLRMSVQPGIYAAQGLAALDIADLRERMRREARERFSVVHFHSAMLQHGPLSPPGLAQAARAAFGV